MADIDIANICIAALASHIEREREVLTSGKISGWDRYQYHLGRLQALEAADGDIREAFRKRYDEGEDEEEDT